MSSIACEGVVRRSSLVVAMVEDDVCSTLTGPFDGYTVVKYKGGGVYCIRPLIYMLEETHPCDLFGDDLLRQNGKGRRRSRRNGYVTQDITEEPDTGCPAVLSLCSSGSSWYLAWL
jgi:hypothetical protein